MMKNSSFAILMAFALMLAVSSCRAKKDVQSEQYTPGTAETVVPTRTLATDFSTMASQYSPWTDITVPVKVSVAKPRSLSLSGTLSMVYGKSINISLKMLFIEAATLYADADSVIAVSKPLGVYYKESLKNFTAAAGLSLADVQSILLGQAFAPGKGTATPSDVSAFAFATLEEDVVPGEIYAFTATPRRRTTDAVDWHYNILAPYDQAIGAPQVYGVDIAAGQNTIECTYAQAEFTPAGIIAAKMQMEGTVKKHAIDVTIASTPSSAKWNTGPRISKPSIPRSASRVSTEQLLKMLGKL